MAASDPTPPLPRRRSAFDAVMAGSSLPMALLIPLWVSLGRTWFGPAGWLSHALAFTAGPLLAVVMLLTAARITANAAAYRPFGAPRRTSLLLLSQYAAAAGFGFLLPDFGDGAGVHGSVLSRLAGEEYIGISAGLANPLGIAALGLTVAVLVTAFRDAARTRSLQQAAAGRAPATASAR